MPFRLGRVADTAPSAAFVAEGEVMFGDAAERRGPGNPGRLVRDFSRRVGDDVPIIAGDRRLAAEDLFARMIAWVVDSVTAQKGASPSALAVTVPVAWGEYRRDLIRAALAREGWPDVDVLSVPEAAAHQYEDSTPLPAHHALAVYDLGGGTFDAVVMRKSATGRLETAGDPTGMNDFGGADFDDAVFRHVVAAAGIDIRDSDPSAYLGLAALRRECVDAKEALSYDGEAVIPVLVQGSHGSVRLTRGEFEAMIEKDIERTIDRFAQALESTGLDGEEIDAILLIGGSSRIPRVAQLLSERFDRPIAVDADPKAIAALGAARIAAERRLVGEPAVDEVVAVAAVEETAPADTGASRRRWFRRVPASAYTTGTALALAGGLVVTTATALGIPALPTRADLASASDASTGPPGASAGLGIADRSELGEYETGALDAPPDASPGALPYPAPGRSRVADDLTERPPATGRTSGGATPSAGRRTVAATPAREQTPPPTASAPRPAPKPATGGEIAEPRGPSDPAPEPAPAVLDPEPASTEPAAEPSLPEPAPTPAATSPDAPPDPAAADPTPDDTPDPPPADPTPDAPPDDTQASPADTGPAHETEPPPDVLPGDATATAL
ncbi:Hsp70 family protein [Microbacterium sulfonylureivorans]|uniref:Hsp70 family protein n=1 Tax=Microbacterium sulfonylureivorans TaxID=2486854 RepID=UPI0013E03948|nr:Hsp70 family protein [Microbacterium sulfonylureivorans]